MNFHQFRKKVKLRAIIVPVVLLAIVIFIVKEWQNEKNDITKYYLAAEVAESNTQQHSDKNSTDTSQKKPSTSLDSSNIPLSLDKQKALIISCKPEDSATLNEPESDNNGTAVNIEKKLNDFENSDDFEGKLAHAISITRAQQAGTSVSKVDALQQLSMESNDKLIHWSLIVSCSHDPDNQNCNKTAIDNALNLDGSNGAMWLNIAILQATNKNHEGTLQALQEVVAAPTYHEYIAEQISLYDNVTAKMGINKERERISKVMGLMSSIEIGNLSSLLNFCQRESLERSDIAQLCIDVGRKLANMGESYLSRSIGTTMQKQIYQLQESDVLLSELSEQEQTISRAWSNERYQKAMDLLNYDTDLLLDWFQKYKTYGERVATDYLVDEAIRLSMDSEYNPCPENTQKVGESIN